MNKFKHILVLLLFVLALVQAAVVRSNSSNAISYAYDLNNNPLQIFFTNGSVTKYVYSASGQKLRTVHYTAKPNITRTWDVKPACQGIESLGRLILNLKIR